MFQEPVVFSNCGVPCDSCKGQKHCKHLKTKFMKQVLNTIFYKIKRNMRKVVLPSFLSQPY